MAILKRVTGDPAGQLIELKSDDDGHRPLARVPDRPRPQRGEPQARRDPQGRQRLLPGRPQLAQQDDRQQHRGQARRRPPAQGRATGSTSATSSSSSTPPPRPRTTPSPTATSWSSPRGTASDDPNMHTLDASRSSALASVVRPEVKLKAILEITRNLSTELRIDTVAPKILDSLMELFPQAERLFLVLVDPETKRLVRKAFKYRPNGKPDAVLGRRARGRGADVDQPVDRQPRPRPEEGRAQPGRRQRQEPADQRLDRRPQDPLGDVRPAADPRQPGPRDHPARHRPTAASSSRTTSTSWPPSPARRRSPSRTPRCTRPCSSASGWTAT